MEINHFIKSTLFKSLVVIAIVFAVLALTPRIALADPPTLTECKEVENCTANDFGLFVVSGVQVNVPGCTDHNGDGITEVNLNFKITYPSNQPNRYDIGSILALDGMEPLRDITEIPGSDCARDWLPPPLTTSVTADGLWPNTLGEFWNGEPGDVLDVCGDVPSSNDATRTYENIWVACEDQDNNGQIDLSICLYYDNNAQNTCTTVMDATEGTTSKCQCQRTNIPVTPTAITLESLEAGSALPVGYMIGIVIVISIVLLAGLWLAWQTKKRAALK
jgi:hypothetical protein